MKTATPRSLLLVVMTLASLVFTSCKPPPRPSPDTPAVTPHGWTDTARTVVNTLAWAVPAAHAVTDLLLQEPERSVVGRALDVTRDAAGDLRLALDAYDARGGDRCAVQGAVAATRAALVSLGHVLVDHGIALGQVLGRVTDAAAALVDELIPECEPDAGWRSVGRDTNAELRAIELRATARGVILRRDLDHIQPPGGGAR